KPNVTMRTFTVGSAVVFDLVSPAAPAAAGTVPPRGLTPVSVPPAAPTPPAGAQAVTVRSADHGDYFRLAFDWPQKTGYKVERRGDRVAIVFDAAANIDVNALNQRLPAANRPAAILTENGKTTITIPMATQLMAKDFASGNTIAVDLTNAPVMQSAKP